MTASVFCVRANDWGLHAPHDFLLAHNTPTHTHTLTHVIKWHGAFLIVLPLSACARCVLCGGWLQPDIKTKLLHADSQVDVQTFRQDTVDPDYTD